MTNLEFHAILNFKMGINNSLSQFIRPYSKGQITIPQEFREFLGITPYDWLFLTIKDGHLMIKPVKPEKVLSEKGLITKPKVSFQKYLKIIPGLKGTFGPELERENRQMRGEVEQKLRKIRF